MLKRILRSILSVFMLVLALTPVQASEYYRVDVGYQSQVNGEWSDFAYGGALTGSESGEALDSLAIHLVDAPYAASIEYRVYTVSGWSEWVQSFESVSQRGEAILGIQVQLKDFPHANVYYQSYREGLGWGIWVSNGKTSGTLNGSSPITGFRVKVDEIGVEYQSSMNGIAQVIRHNGETQGSGSLETVSMSLIRAEANQSIEYRAYLRNEGWTNWAADGVTLGASNKVIEALEARLVGLPQYSVQIQVQVNGEWWGYAYDGQTAGIIGNHQAITGYRVEIVQRVNVAPILTTVVVEEEEPVSFSFNASSGDSCFTTILPSSDDSTASTYVGTIPSGITNIIIELDTVDDSQDVDLELYDGDKDHPIVLYDGGDILIDAGGTPEAAYYTVEPYNSEDSLYVYYSGYEGYDGDHPGDEFIKIRGTTQSNLLIYILNYDSSQAEVQVCYEYGEELVIEDMPVQQ